jgi:hypothetical protein
MHKITIIAGLAALVLVTAACGGGTANSQSRAVNPPAPTPQSPRPEDVVQSLNDALNKATDLLAGKSGASGYGVRGVTSVEYVQTTVARAEALGVGHFTVSATGAVTAWLFVEHGVFFQPPPIGPLQDPTYAAIARFTPSPPVHTLWILAAQGLRLDSGITDNQIDLTSLGRPIVIPPGQIPAIDAVRAPTAASTATPTPPPAAPLAPSGATIAVGTPALINGVVLLPINVSGSSLPAYGGFNIHLRWSSSVFQFNSIDTTGTQLPGSPVCANTADADGAGVAFGCTALNSASTSQAGLLGTVLLKPTGTGCSVLHLFTYGAPDAGDASTGTFLIDPSPHPILVATADGRADQTGHAC